MENNIKNLKIYRNVKKIVVNRVTPIVLAGAIVVSGTSFAYKASNKRHSYKNNSLTSISDSLAVNDDITKIDDNIRYQEGESNELLSELDKVFIESYNNADINKCNEIIAKLSKLILKSQVADGYNLNIEEIKYFDIFGFRNNGETASRDEYGIQFMYNGEDYLIKAKGFAEEICYMYRAASKNQINYKKDSYLNTDLKTDYNKLKAVLTDKLISSNKEVKSKIAREEVEVNGKIKNKKIVYNGTFNFSGNKDLINIASRYAKICNDEVDFIKNPENNNSNLPKKVK